MTDELHSDMVALVGSRICHDLISPLGAIGNGLELLQMMGTGNSPEMALVSDSVETAAIRVKLFRLAFGAATRGQLVGAEEVRAHAARIGQGRIVSQWEVSGNVDRMTAKLGLLLLLCAETLMPFGGEVRIDGDAEHLLLTASASRLRDSTDLLDQLTDAAAPLPQAAEVHFPLARIAAADLGRTISVSRTEAGLRIAA